MFNGYGIAEDDINQVLHILGRTEHLKVELEPFTLKRFELNRPEQGFMDYLPDDINFRMIHRSINIARRKHNYTDNIVQIFHPQAFQELEHKDEIEKQHERASLFYLWRFCKRIKREHLFRIIKFHESHLKLLYIFERCPKMSDMAFSNPGLLMYLIAKSDFSPAGIDRTTSMLKKLSILKHKSIASSLGLKPQIINILKKIHPTCLEKQALTRFVDYLNKNDYPRYIHHLKKIFSAHINILCKDELREHVTPRLMEDLANHSSKINNLDAAEVLEQLICNSKKLNINHLPNKFNSIRHITTFWFDHPFLVGYDLDELDCRLPEPPVRPESHIRPIVDAYDIIKAGHEMDNCLCIDVSSYLDEIKAGAYLYRIHDRYGLGEKAIVLICPAFNNELKKNIYVIEEIRARNNKSVLYSTKKAVIDWLIINQNLKDSCSIQMIEDCCEDDE